MITFDFGAVLVDAPLLLRGAAMTLGLTAVSATAGLAPSCSALSASTG